MISSFLFAAGFLFLLLGLYFLAKYSEKLRFFYSPFVSVFSTTGFLIAALGLGFRLWPINSVVFLSFFFFFLCCLGFRCIHEVVSKKPFQFVLIHCGLFLFMLSLSFGSLSLEKYYMLTRPKLPELRALNIKTGDIRQLPIAIELKSFDISYYETDITKAMEGRPDMVESPIPKRYLANVKVYEYNHGNSAIIEDSIDVNRPLKAGKFHIYNTSFDPYDRGAVTFLLVKDPWLYITYASALLSLLGGISLFIKRSNPKTLTEDELE